jgi:hypothetical protein
MAHRCAYPTDLFEYLRRSKVAASRLDSSHSNSKRGQSTPGLAQLALDAPNSEIPNRSGADLTCSSRLSAGFGQVLAKRARGNALGNPKPQYARDNQRRQLPCDFTRRCGLFALARLRQDHRLACLLRQSWRPLVRRETHCIWLNCAVQPTSCYVVQASVSEERSPLISHGAGRCWSGRPRAGRAPFSSTIIPSR